MPLNKNRILDLIEEAATSTLEVITEAIVANAKQRAPVRKPSKPVGRGRTRAASPALIAATIRRIRSDRTLSDSARRRYIADIEANPSKFRTMVRARGGPPNRPIILGGFRYRPSTNMNTFQSTPKGKVRSITRNERTNPGNRWLIARTKASKAEDEKYYRRPQTGFEVEPGSAFDDMFSSQARHAIKTGEALTNASGGPVDKSTVGRVQFGGRLKNSIASIDRSATGKGYAMRVVASAPYAKYVEFPTRHNAAQPFLLPAMYDEARNLEQEMIAQLRALGVRSHGGG